MLLLAPLPVIYPPQENKIMLTTTVAPTPTQSPPPTSTYPPKSTTIEPSTNTHNPTVDHPLSSTITSRRSIRPVTRSSPYAPKGCKRRRFQSTHLQLRMKGFQFQAKEVCAGCLKMHEQLPRINQELQKLLARERVQDRLAAQRHRQIMNLLSVRLNNPPPP